MNVERLLFGVLPMSAAPEIVRIQENGRVTLPVAICERLGLKEGDLVAIVETPEGLLITPHEIVATLVADQSGDALQGENLAPDE
jgi:AbrB family looped-hinge helix DNA binding protein